MERQIVGGDVDVVRRGGGKGRNGAEGYAGNRENKFAKVHICQCEFVVSAGLAGRQRIMECAAGAGLKRSKVRGFRRGGGLIMLRRLRAVQASGAGPELPASSHFKEAVGGAFAQSYRSSGPVARRAALPFRSRNCATGASICRNPMPRPKPWRSGKRQGTCGNPSQSEGARSSAVPHYRMRCILRLARRRADIAKA